MILFSQRILISIFNFFFQVNRESPSESVGLAAGDVIVAVNGQDITACRHKEAQDVIVRAGNNFKLTIQRYAHLLGTFVCMQSQLSRIFPDQNL